MQLVQERCAITFLSDLTQWMIKEATLFFRKLALEQETELSNSFDLKKENLAIGITTS